MIAAGVPAGKIYRPADMLDDPHFAARQAIVSVDHPRWGELRMQNAFPRLSRTPSGIRSIAPQSVGEHNDEVYGGVLGLSGDEIAGLRSAGAI